MRAQAKLRDLRRPEPSRASSRRAQALTAAEPPAAWYRIGPVVAAAKAADAEPEAAESTRADVYVYDTIGGFWGMTADDFVRDVASLDVDEIVLHLNSPGGDVFEGVAMANVLRQHPARVTVMVDGLAASAGTVVAMAGDEIVMGVGSQMMIHDAWGFCVGNAADMAKTADMLATTSESIASTYAARTGGNAQDWRALMQAETWYTAEEAVTAGLADRIATDDDKGAATGEQVTPGGGSGSFWDLWDSYKAQDRFDLSAFAYAGRSKAPAPAIPAAGSSTEQEGSRAVAFSDEQLNNLRQRLNVADDADEATILAALDTALAERPAPRTAPGTVVLDEAQHTQLLADARDGREARQQQLREQREQAVQAAVSDGRIPPARAEHWLTQLEADPGAAETLASLKPGLIPVNEIGYGTDKAAEKTNADRVYDSLYPEGV